jgi:DNA invertase Pin-like site-specific DNA recombinase
VLHLLAQKAVEVRVVKGDMKLDQSIPSKVWVSMLSLMAEIERDLVSARTKEGLQRARANGVKLGRPAGLSPRSKLDAEGARISRR